MAVVEIVIEVGGGDLDPLLWPPKADFALNDKGTIYRLVPGSLLFVWQSDEEGLRSQLADPLLQRNGCGRQVALLGEVAAEGHVLGRNGGARQVQISKLVRVGFEGETAHFDVLEELLVLPAGHHAEEQAGLWASHTLGFSDLTACRAWFAHNALYFRCLAGDGLSAPEVAELEAKFVTTAYPPHDAAYYDEQRRLNDLLGEFQEANRKLLAQLHDAYMIDDAEERSAQMPPLVAKALDTQTDPDVAGQWQMGALVERLTGALVKTKRFVEAAEFLERYFTLPTGYYSRSTVSGDETMRKRLERCRKQS